MVHKKEKLTIFTILLFISIKQNQILRDYNSDRKSDKEDNNNNNFNNIINSIDNNDVFLNIYILSLPHFYFSLIHQGP